MVSSHPPLPGRRALLGLALASLLILGLGTAAPGAEPVGRLSGTVTGAGATLANAWVTVTPVDSRGSASGPAQRTVTDASGRYDFPALPPGQVKVQVRAPLLGRFVDTYWHDAFTFNEADLIPIDGADVTADLDLPIGGSVDGQVVEAGSGTPVQGARVTAALARAGSSGSVGASGPASGPGRFSLTGLPPVPLELSVSLPPGSPYLAPSADPSGSSPSIHLDGRASTTGLTIGLRRSAEITGTVLDDAGVPVAGSDVRLLGCLPACPPHATSDATGRYRLRAVAPGHHLGVAAVPGEELLGPWYPSRENAARVTDLTVEEGEVLDSVDLTLPRSAFVSLAVRGADGTEPLRAIVRLTTLGRTYSQYFAGRPDAEPAAGPGTPVQLRVGPVPPGEYSVTITVGVADPGYLPSRWVTDSGIPATPTIRLVAGEETRSIVSLAPAGGAPDLDVAPSDPTTPGGWPGLAQGFLSPTGWPYPFGSRAS